MWYDLASSPPPPGSLLELVFSLVFIQRQTAQVYGARADILAALVSAREGVETKGVVEAFTEYVDAFIPFKDSGGKSSPDIEAQRKALAEHIKRPARINLGDFYRQQVAAGQIMARRTLNQRSRRKR